MATVAFVLASGFLVAAVGVGAFLLVSEPAAVVTAAYLRWRETKREKERAA